MADRESDWQRWREHTRRIASLEASERQGHKRKDKKRHRAEDSLTVPDEQRFKGLKERTPRKGCMGRTPASNPNDPTTIMMVLSGLLA